MHVHVFVYLLCRHWCEILLSLGFERVAVALVTCRQVFYITEEEEAGRCWRCHVNRRRVFVCVIDRWRSCCVPWLMATWRWWGRRISIQASSSNSWVDTVFICMCVCYCVCVCVYFLGALPVGVDGRGGGWQRRGNSFRGAALPPAVPVSKLRPHPEGPADTNRMSTFNRWFIN